MIFRFACVEGRNAILYFTSLLERLKLFVLGTVCIASVFLLSGCGSSSAQLEGSRITLFSQGGALSVSDQAQAVVVPDSVSSPWQQDGGNSYHVLGNVSLSFPLKEIWDTSFGEGGDDIAPLITKPVVGGGLLYTLDAEGLVSAFDIKNGDQQWSYQIPLKSNQSFGGGVAYHAGILYATSGTGQVIALNNQGKVVWHQNLAVIVRRAPVVSDRYIVVSALNDSIYVLDRHDGHTLWTASSSPKMTKLLGGSGGVALQGGRLVAVYSSGDVVAYDAASGIVGWRINLALGTDGNTDSFIPDIRAAPVIDGNIAYVVSHAGFMVALNMAKGTRIWEHRIKGTQMPWVSGDDVFVLSSDGTLIALNKKTGFIVWMVSLSHALGDNHMWYGPLMAGNRLLVASHTGTIAMFNPKNGAFIGRYDTDDMNGAPIVSHNMMFVQSRDADITAYQ